MEKYNNKLLNKYKIYKIDNLFYNKILINKLNNLYENIDNLILFGKVGSGKTSIINLLKKKYKTYLQLSNFNSKGYDYIMNTINDFIKQKKDIVKIIFFDNLDIISNKAQYIISDIINVQNCKIVISCEDINNIIESIQSNCIIVKLFIEKDILFNNLKDICNKENIKYNDDSLHYLIDTYDYDIRKIINIIDVINICFNDISIENINKILNKLDFNKLNIIIELLLKKKLLEAINNVNLLLDDGYSIDDILLAIINIIQNSTNIIEETKLNLINIINQKYIIINETINSKLQLYGCFSQICSFN